MDDQELVKAGLEVALRPITEIAENALGLLGGDWLSEKRARNRSRLREETEKVAKARNAKLDADPSPSVITPLLGAAQDEARDELVKIWAALAATAMDPKRIGLYRREFVNIAKNLEPVDVLVLPLLTNPSPMQPSRREFIAAQLGLPIEQVELAFRNLKRLELVGPQVYSDYRVHPYVEALGRQFLAAVQES